MKNNRILQKLFKNVLSKKDNENIIIVGFDGKGCSGKTTIARLMLDMLKADNIECAYLSIDDFCNKRAVRYDNTVETSLQVYYNNFDESLFEDVLKKVKSQPPLSIDVVTLNTKTDKLENRILLNLNKGGILIVEGLHLFKANFRNYFDLKIMIHISDEEQLQRALIRDPERGNSEEMIHYKYKNRFTPSYIFYQSHDFPEEVADFIIDNNDPDKQFFIKEPESGF